MNPVLRCLVFTRVLVLVCLTACGQPREDASTAESIAVAERFMRAVVSGDSASMAATTTASLARDLRRAIPDSTAAFVRSALATFRPGDLIRGDGDLLLEFTYTGAGGRQKGYIRLDDKQGLKVAGILAIENHDAPHRPN